MWQVSHLLKQLQPLQLQLPFRLQLQLLLQLQPLQLQLQLQGQQQVEVQSDSVVSNAFAQPFVVRSILVSLFMLCRVRRAAVHCVIPPIHKKIMGGETMRRLTRGPSLPPMLHAAANAGIVSALHMHCESQKWKLQFTWKPYVSFCFIAAWICSFSRGWSFHWAASLPTSTCTSCVSLCGNY